MNKRKRFVSLRFKLVAVLLSSIVLAVIAFFTVYEFGGFLVWRYYLDESNKQQRAEKYTANFQEYVADNKLSINDTDAISKWRGGWYVDIIIFKDQNLVYAPDWFEDFKDDEDIKLPDENESGDDETGGESGEELVPSETETGSEILTETETETETESETEDKHVGEGFYEGWFSGDRSFEKYLTEEARSNYRTALKEALSDNSNVRPVYFVDGTLLVSIVDFTEEAMNNIVFAVSVVSAMGTIAIVILMYFYTVTRRIKQLASNVRQVERGDYDRYIKDDGNDDISNLADDVNSMRDAIVDKMSKEKRAWEANAGLITAMSHDIRTPLTVLLGYLELIEMQNNDEQNQEYISACRDNAMRLKNLSDDMFSYFLVFGKGEAKLECLPVDAREWLGHVFAEQQILLFEKGFTFEENEFPDAKIRIDEKQLRRVLDNMFSNIIKYAAHDYPIKVSATVDGDSFLIVCRNMITKDVAIPESNGIGLKTCAKIMEEMGGSFAHFESNGEFTVELSIPIEENDNSDS